MKNVLILARNFWLSVFILTIPSVWAQTTYYWVGGTGTQTFNTVANWNTTLGGGGTSPATISINDIFVVDGDDLGGGAQGGLNLEMSGNTNVGQFILRDNAQSLTITDVGTYALNIGGAIGGTDFSLGEGCNLTVTNTSVLFSISDAGFTALIAGTATIQAFSTMNVQTSTGALTTVTGSVINHGNFPNASEQRLVFENGSLYEHARDGNILPPATWNTGSTCKISGVVNTYPSNNHGTFYNYIWDCPGQTTVAANAISSALTINGNFIIGNNAGSYLELPNVPVTVNGNTIVGGNVGGRLSVVAGAEERTFNGNFTIGSGATLFYNNGANMVFKGNFTSDGTLSGPAASTTIFKFKGTGKTIGGSGNLTFPYVQLNSTGSVTLNSDVTINSSLTLTAGTLDIASKTLTLNHIINTGNGRIDADAGTLRLNYGIPLDNVLLNDEVKNLTLSESYGEAFSALYLVVTNALNLNNSSLTTSGTINMAGSTLLKGSGQIDARSGAMLFTNSSALALPAALFHSEFINDLTMNGSGGVTLGSDLTVKNALTLTAGKLDIASYYFTQSGNTVARSAGNIDADDGTFILNHTQPLTLPANVFAGNVKYFILSSSAGVTHSSPTTVTSQFSILAGQFTLGNFDLNIGTASLSAGSTNHYVKTTGTGRFIREIGANVSLFPVGRTYYNPVSISNYTGTDDVFSVRVEDAVYVNGLNGSEINTPRVNATWHIGKTNPTADAGSGVDMVFEWWEPQELLGINTFRLNHHDGTGWKFAQTSGVPNMMVNFSGSRRYHFPGYMGTFSPFAFGQGLSPLPVKLRSFEASCAEGRVELEWITESEINNERFTVCRSSDLQSWEELLSLPGAGNSNAPLTYTAADERPHDGINYYRLTQTDYDGRFEHFEPIYAFCTEGNVEESLTVFPNPSDGLFTVLLNEMKLSGKISLQLSDLSGRGLKTFEFESSAGLPFTVDLSEFLPGMYLLTRLDAVTSKNPVKIMVR
jgi:hypothetical protein